VPDIRLMRSVNEPGDRGPSRGMYALQRALRKENIPWLKIGGALKLSEIPWFWLYRDSTVAAQFSDWGWPFVIGPNVLFKNSGNPGCDSAERSLLDAESCALQFTESVWYASLIKRYCNHNEAPIVLWPYPISPVPGGPLPVKHDVLLYLKDMILGKEVIRAQKRWPKHCAFIYGHYNRDDMILAARQSRFCLYLSTDDRGPLALAEILLAGCPAIGIPTGAPWLSIDPRAGISIPHWGLLEDAERSIASFSREAVREWAMDYFSGQRTVGIIKAALEPIATRGALT
jgi:hypothetical protein